MLLNFGKTLFMIRFSKVRSQEEIMNECQVWWTLTGNFGNMMPIDWSKSYTRANQLPTLNLCAPRPIVPPAAGTDYSDEDDLVAADLDMHQLILQSDTQNSEPIKSAEEVLQEIDDIGAVSSLVRFLRTPLRAVSVLLRSVNLSRVRMQLST